MVHHAIEVEARGADRPAEEENDDDREEDYDDRPGRVVRRWAMERLPRRQYRVALGVARGDKPLLLRRDEIRHEPGIRVRRPLVLNGERSGRVPVALIPVGERRVRVRAPIKQNRACRDVFEGPHLLPRLEVEALEEEPNEVALGRRCDRHVTLVESSDRRILHLDSKPAVPRRLVGEMIAARQPIAAPRDLRKSLADPEQRRSQQRSQGNRRGAAPEADAHRDAPFWLILRLSDSGISSRQEEIFR
mmetsp:Transcript_66722/g.158256  ORF Transcript_66722/g.158256 Transcript_66722/m.158256 type:complete len:247 (-) Transcript_66722:25-765(-)